MKAKVTRIEPISGAKGCRFRLWLEDGQFASPRRVVLATGGGVPQLPAWVSQIQPPYPQSDRRQARHRHPIGRDSGTLAGRHPRSISRADCQEVARAGRTSAVARFAPCPHRPSSRIAGGAGGAESLRCEDGQREDCARTAKAQSGTNASRSPSRCLLHYTFESLLLNLRLFCFWLIYFI